MPKYQMMESNERYKVILHGSKIIGRVCRHADGTYIGIIGKYIIVRGCPSEKVAFLEATAQHMRYEPHLPKVKVKVKAKEKLITVPELPIKVYQFAQMSTFRSLSE